MYSRHPAEPAELSGLEQTSGDPRHAEEVDLTVQVILTYSITRSSFETGMTVEFMERSGVP